MDGCVTFIGANLEHMVIGATVQGLLSQKGWQVAVCFTR